MLSLQIYIDLNSDSILLVSTVNIINIVNYSFEIRKNQLIFNFDECFHRFLISIINITKINIFIYNYINISFILIHLLNRISKNSNPLTSITDFIEILHCI